MMTRALRDYNPERLAKRESQDRQRRRWHKLIVRSLLSQSCRQPNVMLGGAAKWIHTDRRR
jgi:hypothetical protein